MSPDLFWIKGPWSGRLAIAARPRGGDWLDDDVRGFDRARVDTVVSLLEPDESRELGLSDEGGLVRTSRMSFIPFPIPDRGIPASTADALALVYELVSRVKAGETVAIHCRQGVGRSALIAAGVLMAAGIDVNSAVASVVKARGLVVPETAEQDRWLRGTFSESILAPAPR